MAARLRSTMQPERAAALEHCSGLPPPGPTAGFERRASRGLHPRPLSGRAVRKDRSVAMTSARRVVDLVVRCCLTPAVQALMSLGGIDIHVAVRNEQWVPFK